MRKPAEENQPDLLEGYPDGPGWQKTDTSLAAAQAVVHEVGYVQALVVHALRGKPQTSEELADGIGISYATVQPRTSELRARELIEDSGARKKNKSSGRSAIVWRLKP